MRLFGWALEDQAPDKNADATTAIKKLRDNNAIQETFAPQLFIIVADESWQQNLGGDGQSLLFISQTVSEDDKGWTQHQR